MTRKEAMGVLILHARSEGVEPTPHDLLTLRAMDTVAVVARAARIAQNAAESVDWSDRL